MQNKVRTTDLEIDAIFLDSRDELPCNATRTPEGRLCRIAHLTSFRLGNGSKSLNRTAGQRSVSTVWIYEDSTKQVDDAD
jgi:hypothetical protein